MRNMVLLLDENISHQYTHVLRDVWYTVYHVADTNHGISDETVLVLAKKLKAILITYDSDFWQLLFAGSITHTFPLIYLRDKQQRKKQLLKALIYALHTLSFIDYMFVKIDTEKMRVAYRK